MKRITSLVMLMTISVACATAQLEIKSNGKNIVGPDRSGDDIDGVLSMSIFGKNGEYRAGSKLAFGDFGPQVNNAWNVFIGEWGEDDSDKLWIHGKYGIRFTTWDAEYLLGEWNVLNSDKNFAVYSRLRADRMSVSSDDNHKSNVTDIPNALSRLMQLNGKTYSYEELYIGTGVGDEQTRTATGSEQVMSKKDSLSVRMLEQERASRTTRSSTRYGLLASELALQFPELVETDVYGHRYINYLELVPVLISAINELYDAIEDAGLVLGVQTQGGGAKGAKLGVGADATTEENEGAKLYQNTPNPFSAETVIEYYVPAGAKSATLYVFNLSGEMLQNHPLKQYGHGMVTLSGGTLAAGMYVYSLVVDGQIVDTKQMILTK